MFSVRGYSDDFYTGRTSDSRQVVLGLLCPDLVAYFFGPDGRWLNREVRPLEHPAPGAESQDYNLYDEQFQTRLGQQLRTWMKEIGFAACPIQVKAFLDESYSVGVGDEEDAGIVFYWAKEYYLSLDGEVEST